MRLPVLRTELNHKMILHVHEYETAAVVVDVGNITHCRDERNSKTFFANLSVPRKVCVPFDEWKQTVCPA